MIKTMGTTITCLLLGKRVEDLICPICHLATLQEHPEKQWKDYFIKCTHCGYSEKKGEKDD